MQIPKRLQVIGDLIPDGASIADIGADHGLLEQYIAISKENYKILAIENKEGPLAALHNGIGALKNIDISHSDGMNQVTEDYDTVVLAGMGGDNIINILSKNPKKLKFVSQIIVDAHSFIPKVRSALIDFGFDIDQEKIVFEANKFYVIISFKRNSSQRTYTNDEIEFGYKIFEDPLFCDYKNHLKKELQKVSEILKKIPNEKEKYDLTIDQIRRLELYGQN